MKFSQTAMTVAATMTIAACGDSTSDALYAGAESAALGAQGNEARCSSCHALEQSPGFSGTPMTNIAFRSAYKGGGAPTLLDATNACVTGWMGGEALTADDARYVELKAYMESISDPSVTEPPSLAPEVLADEAAYGERYANGDASAGAAKYEQSCGGCHDSALKLGVVPSLPKASLAGATAGRIAQKVRTSGPPPSGMSDASDTTPGPMPFFEPDELSQQDLADIIAHILQPAS